MGALKVAGSDHFSHSGRSFWVPVAHLLVSRGATWDPQVRDDLGRSQLMMLCSGPAPPRKDWDTLLGLVQAAVDAGLDVNTRSKDGVSVLALVKGRDGEGTDGLMTRVGD